MIYTRATMPAKPNLAISPKRRVRKRLTRSKVLAHFAQRALLETYVDRITKSAEAEGEYRRRWHEQNPGAASRVYLGEES